MSKKIVGISQRVDRHPERDETRDAVDQRLVEWVAGCGFIPVTVPNILRRRELLREWLKEVQPNGLILSGGNDFGEIPERDQTELELLDWAQSKNTPVLGICRGMQVMAVWAGAELIAGQGHVKTRHNLTFLGKSRDVNSYHDLIIQSCPEGFVVEAEVKNGEIEAIRHKFLPFHGWMWHPERESTISDLDTKNLIDLFN